MRITSLKLSVLALVAVAALAMVPAASANSFNITANNLGLSGTLGTVTTTQNGSDVDVTISMSSGYALLLNGGDIGLTTTGGLVLTGTSLSNFSIAGLSSSLKNSTTIGSFTFDFIYKTSVSGGQQFPTSLSFTILNANVNQITGLGIHICVLDNTGQGCATTGFAATTGTPVVPEPGTLGLLGTGLVGIAGLLRRRFLS